MDATNKSAAEELLTHLDELGVNSKVLVEQGLLDGWKSHSGLGSYLMLQERSLPLYSSPLRRDRPSGWTMPRCNRC